MKNLNKKIGAMALAGMMVAGGFGVSRVSAASSNLNYNGLELAREFNLLSQHDKDRISDVEQLCDRLKIPYPIDVARYSNKLDKSFRDLELKGALKVISNDNLDFIEFLLKREQRSGNNYIKLQYQGLYYLLVIV